MNTDKKIPNPIEELARKKHNYPLQRLVEEQSLEQSIATVGSMIQSALVDQCRDESIFLWEYWRTGFEEMEKAGEVEASKTTHTGEESDTLRYAWQKKCMDIVLAFYSQLETAQRHAWGQIKKPILMIIFDRLQIVNDVLAGDAFDRLLITFRAGESSLTLVQMARDAWPRLKAERAMQFVKHLHKDKLLQPPGYEDLVQFLMIRIFRDVKKESRPAVAEMCFHLSTLDPAVIDAALQSVSNIGVLSADVANLRRRLKFFWSVTPPDGASDIITIPAENVIDLNMVVSVSSDVPEDGRQRFLADRFAEICSKAQAWVMDMSGHYRVKVQISLSTGEISIPYER